MPTFEHAGITFHYLDRGTGRSFVFLHGLGGDTEQTASLFDPPPGVRFLSMDFRAHGQTRPVGDPAKLRIAVFADDVVALLDRLNVPEAVVGGISLGAAVAINLALRYPQRTTALVLSRPAWLEGPMEANARRYARIARLIRELGPREGLARFRQSPEYLEMADLSPDAAGSLVRQFEHPRAEEAVQRLECLPADAPYPSLDVVRSIAVPTLVLANHMDPIHPYSFAEELSRRIPGAALRELTPKSVSRERHAVEVRALLEQFLSHVLSERNLTC